MTEREIFLEAVEMTTPEARAAYLQGVCGRDATLRRKVDDLLKEHFSNDSLLAAPACAAEAAWARQGRAVDGERTAIEFQKTPADPQEMQKAE